MQKDTRLYRLEPGLQELLVIAAAGTLEEAVARWRLEIESGEVSHQLRQVIIAMGWVTSDRDWRLALVGPRRTRRSKNAPDLGPVAEAGAELMQAVVESGHRTAETTFTVPVADTDGAAELIAEAGRRARRNQPIPTEEAIP